MTLSRFPEDAKRDIFLFVFLAILSAPLFLPARCFGQPLKKSLTATDEDRAEAGKEVTLPASVEEINKEIARLRTRLREIRSRSIPFGGEGTSVEVDGRAVAFPEEIEEWQRLNLEIVFHIENHLNALQGLKEIRNVNKERAAERNKWRGFAGSPPFPVSILEEQHDLIKDKQAERNFLQVKIGIVEGQLEEYLENLKDAGAELRLAEERVADGKGEEQRERAMWLRDLARLKYELAEAGVLSFEIQRLVFGEDLSGRMEDLAFLEQRYRLAESVSPISQEDRDQKLKELENQKKSVRNKLNRALREEEAAHQALEKSRNALQKAQQGFPAGRVFEPAERERLDFLGSAQEAERTRLDTARLKISGYQGMLRLLTIERQMWEDRYRTGEKSGLEEVRKQSGEIRQKLERLRLWKNSLEDGLDKLAPLATSQREKLASGGLAIGEERVTQTFVTAYTDREVLYRQALKSLSRTERVAERWETDLNALGDRLAKSQSIVEQLKAMTSPFRKIWNTELYVAEESAIVDNQKISRPISVTVGKVAKALLILLLGVWVARRLKRPVEGFAARRFHLDEGATKRVGRKWSFFTFIVLFTFALTLVNIPLAVFAFFGGTLAIAAGFGAQHLIGNFISSVILLFDRTIQVGDVVEIEGHRGRVTAIGMRSSAILRFDGVEMLVPNSQFLEQRVTNWTHSDKKIRYEITVGVAYRSPTKKVSDIILKVVKEDPHTLEDPAPDVIFQEFGDSALIFRVYLWLVLETYQKNRVVLSNIRHRIKEVLDEAGIVIAFPQRDVHLEATSPVPVRVVDAEISQGVSLGAKGETGQP